MKKLWFVAVVLATLIGISATSLAQPVPAPPGLPGFAPGQSDLVAKYHINSATGAPVVDTLTFITEVAGEGTQTFSLGAPAGNPALPPPTVFLESDGTISDIFGVVALGQPPTITWQSDGETPLVVDPALWGPAPGFAVPELPGVWWDMTFYVDPASSFVASGERLAFMSDVEAVPLPAAAWAGMALLAGLGIRRKLRMA